MGKLENKCAVIIGGDPIVSSAIARSFICEDVEKLCIVSEAGRDAVHDAEPQATCIECELKDPKSTRNMFEHIKETFGHVDVMVYVVTEHDGHKAIAETDDALWNRVVQANQTAAFYCCREAARIMAEQKCGSIIFVASTAAISGAAGTAYACTNHGVLSVARNTAMLFGGSGVRCNTICPGPTIGIPGCADKLSAERSESANKMAVHVDCEMPFIEPADIAKAVLFFASDDSKAINGQWLAIDHGGYC